MTRIVVALWRPSPKPVPRRGWSAGELERRRKADGEKLKIARRLRAETTMTGGWIAERLAMGTLGYLADTLRNDDEFSKYGNLRD
jgi:hypothetical protein